MITLQGFTSLAAQSVTAPREVARLLLALPLSREAVGLCLALVLVLNTLVFSLGQLMSGPPPDGMALLLSTPVAFAGLLGGSMIALILSLYWTGRGLGGRASLMQVTLLVTWLQALRVIVQVALLAIVPLMPALGGLVMIAASALGIWILVNFLHVAQETPTLGKAALMLVLSVVGMALGLTLIFSLVGLSPQGMTANV